MSDSDYLTALDLEAMTGTPASTYRYWASVGDGPPSFKLGRRRVWKRSEVMAWLDEQQQDRPLRRGDRPAALNDVCDVIEALTVGDYEKADAIIPSTAANARVLEACGIAVRLLRETDRPDERLDQLRRESVTSAT